jgi:hypothetical protein
MVYDKWNRFLFPVFIAVIELLAGYKLILVSISGFNIGNLPTSFGIALGILLIIFCIFILTGFVYFRFYRKLSYEKTPSYFKFISYFISILTALSITAVWIGFLIMVGKS